MKNKYFIFLVTIAFFPCLEKLASKFSIFPAFPCAVATLNNAKFKTDVFDNTSNVC